MRSLITLSSRLRVANRPSPISSILIHTNTAARSSGCVVAAAWIVLARVGLVGSTAAASGVESALVIGCC